MTLYANRKKNVDYFSNLLYLIGMAFLCSIRSFMENLGIFFIVLGGLMFAFVNANRFFKQRNLAKSFEKELETNPKLADLQKANEIALAELESFLKESHFYEMTGHRGDEKIYKYVLNDKKLYQFDTFLAPSNMRFGVDQDTLNFRGLSYKRVSNLTELTEFTNKFSLNLAPCA